MDDQTCIQERNYQNQFLNNQFFQYSQNSESFSSQTEWKNNSILVDSSNTNQIPYNSFFPLISEEFGCNSGNATLFPQEKQSQNQSSISQPDDRFIPNRQTTNTQANTYILSSKENCFLFANNQSHLNSHNGGGIYSSETNAVNYYNSVGNYGNPNNTGSSSSGYSSNLINNNTSSSNTYINNTNMVNNSTGNNQTNSSGGQGIPSQQGVINSSSSAGASTGNSTSSNNNNNNLNNNNQVFPSSFSRLMQEMILNNNKSYYSSGSDSEKQLFPNYTNKHRIMSYQHQIEPSMSMSDSLKSTYEHAAKKCDGQKQNRFISPAPEKILDAPELRDDYYLNLMDWGQNGILAVCLNQSVYLWNSYNGDIQMLLSSGSEQNYVSSVSWMNKGNCLAVGFANNVIQVWDTQKFAPLRNLMGHKGRISSMSWNNYILSSGSRDTNIINHDVRSANNVIAKLLGHTQEVCGLKWSCDGAQLASGGNDNNLMIWDLNLQTARHTFTEHQAAVQALAWCPWQQNLLASGGGTADQTMKFWSTDEGKLVQSLDADSQVCSILWNRYDQEIISSHGYSQNQLCVWKYPSLQKITELHGHQNRVLHMSLSPDGSTVCSAASDQTLRFWKVFDVPTQEKQNQNNCGLQTNTISLR